MDKQDIILVYDKQCPLCDHYCRWLRIQKTAGHLRLIDARQAGDMMDEISRLGLDIDQGMVLKIHEQIFYGSDAIHALALISSRSGLFNRLNYHIFKSRRLSRQLYPLLRSCRNLLLKLMRKSKINNLQLTGNDRF